MPVDVKRMFAAMLVRNRLYAHIREAITRFDQPDQSRHYVSNFREILLASFVVNPARIFEIPRFNWIKINYILLQLKIERRNKNMYILDER